MSRLYDMSVTVTGVPEDKVDPVIEACCGEWDFDTDSLYAAVDKDSGLPLLYMTGEANLCGGESEEEFATRLAEAIWVANKGRCRVQVGATCLENMPREVHIRE